RLDALYDRAFDAMLDDLNTPEAIAASIEGAKLIQGIGTNLNAASARSARTWLDAVNDLLGIVYQDIDDAESEAEDPFKREVDRLLNEREQARGDRDFERADAIRARLDEMDVEVMDTPEGTRWRRKVTI
ncbi:MAG: DALR domain-containing protein, partial [Rhodothermales bacterium]